MKFGLGGFNKYPSLKFCEIEKFSPQVSKNNNLFYQNFDAVSFLPRNFIITTENVSCKFNVDMIKNTSSIIKILIENNSDFSRFHINIKDNNNTLEKFERLYLGQQVIFYQDDFYVAQKIVKTLNINDFPSFENQNKDMVVEINKKSFLSFLRNKQFQTFTISTRKKEYKCNIIGINSSKTLNNLINDDPKLKSYSYDFADEEEEFETISNFFNFNPIDFKPRNARILQKICDDLKIECLRDRINEFINYYEFSIQFINNKHTILDPVDKLFEHLYNRKNLSAESVSKIIVDSIWSHGESNIQEFVACMIQVIYTDLLLHPFLVNLIELLDKSKSEENDLKLLIPFLVQKLMTNIGCNKSNCAFIYRLSQKEIISKEEIAETIYSKLALNDKDISEEKNEHHMFINKYMNIIDPKFDDHINNALVWFFPELTEIKNMKISDIESKLNKEHKDFVDSYEEAKFKEMRNSGEPDNKITKALRHDDVDELKQIVKPNRLIFGKRNIVPFNIFDSIIDNGNISYINYAAAYGSIKCFNYLLSINESVNIDTIAYAIFGQNKEIIEIADQNYTKQKNSKVNNCGKFSPQNKTITPFAGSKKMLSFQKNNSLSLLNISTDTKSFFNLYSFTDKNSFGGPKVHPIFPAILKHNNDIFNCVLEHKYELSTFHDYNIFLLLFQNNNPQIIVQFIKKGFYLNNLTNQQIKEIITITTSSGYYRLTELIIGLIFNFNNRELLKNPLTVIRFEDSISFGNFSIFKLYAALNVNQLNFKNSLAIALMREYLSIVEYSLAFPFIQNYQFSKDDLEDLLKLAIYKTKTDLFSHLIDRFGKHMIINDNPDQSDDSLLCYACSFNNIKAAKLIVDQLLEYNPKTDCSLPLVYAAYQGFDEICKYLIDKKVALNFSRLIINASFISKSHKETFSIIYNAVDQQSKEKLANKCFYESIKNHNKDLVEFLLKTNVSYDHALLEAVLTNDIDIVNIILDHDSTPLLINKNSDKGTALNIAVNQENIIIVKRLLSISEIDPSILSNDENPLISAFKRFNVDIIDLLYDFYGKDIQSQSWQINIALREILLKISRSFSLSGMKISAVIKKILEIENIDYNLQINDYTLLSCACEYDQTDIVEKLLKYKDINVNTFAGCSGSSPLMYAIKNKNIEMTKLLIQAGRININQRNYGDQTALTVAVINRSEEIIDLIINHETFDPKESNIDYAFFISDYQISKKLISVNGLDVNYIMTYENNLGGSRNSWPLFSNSLFQFNLAKHPNIERISFETTLMNAVRMNDVDKIELIIQHQSFDPIKSQIKESIFKAASLDQISIIKLLPIIDNDVNIHSPNDESLLVVSSRRNSNNVIQYIVKESNFDPLKSDIQSAFGALLSNESEVSLDMLELLLKKDKNHLINFNQLLPNGKSFFTILSPKIKNLKEVIKYLMDHNVDANCVDKFGETPFQYAIMSNSLDFVNSLIDSKKIDFSQRIHFKVNYNDYVDDTVTSTYLHLAAKNDNLEIFKRILGLNVIDINEKDSQGETPLMISVRYKRKEFINELFKNENLNYLMVNNQGLDALDIKKILFKPDTRQIYLMRLTS